jgi:hypothetical protein
MIVCPRGCRQRETVLPGWCAVGARVSRGATASVKVRSFSGTPSAADRREGVERHPPTVAPARCKQLYESVGKILPEAKSEKLMKSRKPICS